MQIATVSKNGFPSVRTVLLKDIINRNFVFYTNYESRKSRSCNMFLLEVYKSSSKGCRWNW